MKDRVTSPLTRGIVVDVGEHYEGNDFYCDVALPYPDRLDVVHDSANVLAYHHTRPFWPVHIVVVPKQHVGSLTTLTPDDEPLVRELFAVVTQVASVVEQEHGARADQPRPLPGLQAPPHPRVQRGGARDVLVRHAEDTSPRPDNSGLEVERPDEVRPGCRAQRGIGIRRTAAGHPLTTQGC